MTEFDRREFFRRTSWAAGAAALPGWLVRGFSIQEGGDTERQRSLRTVNHRAIAHGKPMLVFVVPTAHQQFWDRGELLGMFLNHCDSEALLDLALCEPACATLEELRDTLKTGDVAGDPLMVLIEHDPAKSEELETHARPVPIHPEFDQSAPDAPNRAFGTPEELQAQAERNQARITAIARALRTALVPDPAALAARADASRARRSSDDHAELSAFFDGQRAPAAEVLVRNAAIVRMAAEAPRREGDRERLLSPLTEAARELIIEAPVPGSKWARPTGCGVDIEGEANGNAGIACGMGMVPPLGRRMLYFFTGS